MRRYAAVAVALLGAACGGPQEVGSSGAECFRDDDCVYGLICAVPEGGSERVCTADVSGLVSVVEPPVATGGTPVASAGSANNVGGTGGANGGANAGRAGGAGRSGTVAGSGGAAAGAPATSGNTAGGGAGGNIGAGGAAAGTGGLGTGTGGTT